MSSRTTLLTAVYCLAVLYSGAGAAMAQERSDYYSTSATRTGADLSDWMKTVPDYLPLNFISIPGTHDSCALYGGDAVRCQTLSIADQLKSGIRFLDIRCRAVGDSFAIHHGAYYQKIGFGDVQKQCIEFLRQHPNECIIMSVKKEQEARKGSLPFTTIFANYVRQANDVWYLKHEIPRMGDVRGRIVLLSRERDLGGKTDDGLGGLTLWKHFIVEDHYSVPTAFHLPKKWDYVKANVDAAGRPHGAKCHLTYTNGVGGGGLPYAVARYINKRLFNHITTTRYVGVVVMDFPGPKLIQRVIQSKN